MRYTTPQVGGFNGKQVNSSRGILTLHMGLDLALPKADPAICTHLYDGAHLTVTSSDQSLREQQLVVPAMWQSSKQPRYNTA